MLSLFNIILIKVLIFNKVLMLLFFFGLGSGGRVRYPGYVRHRQSFTLSVGYDMGIFNAYEPMLFFPQIILIAKFSVVFRLSGGCSMEWMLVLLALPISMIMGNQFESAMVLIDLASNGSVKGFAIFICV